MRGGGGWKGWRVTAWRDQGKGRRSRWPEGSFRVRGEAGAGSKATQCEGQPRPHARLRSRDLVL